LLAGSISRDLAIGDYTAVWIIKLKKLVSYSPGILSSFILALLFPCGADYAAAHDKRKVV